MLWSQDNVKLRRLTVVRVIAVIGLAAVGFVVLVSCSVSAQQSPYAGNNTFPAKTNNAVLKVQMQKQNENPLESISMVSFDGTQFTASVISHGCTSSENFVVEHEVVNGQCRVSFVRTKPDLCRRAPMLAELSLAWSVPENCSDLELVIANPVLVTASEGGISKRFK